MVRDDQSARISAPNPDPSGDAHAQSGQGVVQSPEQITKLFRSFYDDFVEQQVRPCKIRLERVDADIDRHVTYLTSLVGAGAGDSTFESFTSLRLSIEMLRLLDAENPSSQQSGALRDSTEDLQPTAAASDEYDQDDGNALLELCQRSPNLYVLVATGANWRKILGTMGITLVTFWRLSESHALEFALPLPSEYEGDLWSLHKEIHEMAGQWRQWAIKAAEGNLEMRAFLRANLLDVGPASESLFTSSAHPARPPSPAHNPDPAVQWLSRPVRALVGAYASDVGTDNTVAETWAWYTGQHTADVMTAIYQAWKSTSTAHRALARDVSPFTPLAGRRGIAWAPVLQLHGESTRKRKRDHDGIVDLTRATQEWLAAIIDMRNRVNDDHARCKDAEWRADPIWGRRTRTLGLIGLDSEALDDRTRSTSPTVWAVLDMREHDRHLTCYTWGRISVGQDSPINPIPEINNQLREALSSDANEGDVAGSSGSRGPWTASVVHLASHWVKKRGDTETEIDLEQVSDCLSLELLHILATVPIKDDASLWTCSPEIANIRSLFDSSAAGSYHDGGRMRFAHLRASQLNRALHMAGLSMTIWNAICDLVPTMSAPVAPTAAELEQ